ncbi:MAG TPA: SMC family ATPase, partial [Acidimicrobiales bacterium]
MRPLRLELEGFTAFRDRTVVDFEGAELFALTGPTGSGKSSLVDAMVFALYGSVPRLDRRAVAPVVSLGRSETKVRLDFLVGDERYTAVRVVRRTKTGATTKEARLEGPGGQVLAGNERELGQAVEALLGLGFDHFTTCVVLPQGEFARLLHEEPRKRQDLLVSLLDLGLYERMGQLARERERTARQQADLAGVLLGRLAFATPEARGEAAARHDLLVALAEEVVREAPALDELAAAERDARAEAAASATRARLLAAVAVPEGVADRAAAVAAAAEALDEAEREEAAATAAADAAEAALAALPRRDQLEAALRAHDERSRHLAQQEKGRAVLAERVDGETAAAATLARAEERAAAAQAAVDHARWEHRAADLAAVLVAGEPCPVCRQAVHEPPTGPAVGVGEVRAAEAAARQAAAEVDRARRALAAAQRDRVEVETKLGSIADQLAALGALLADHPDPSALRATLATVAAASAAWDAASTRDRQARRAVLAARRTLEDLRRRESADRRTFDEARDRVAALGAPPPGRDDVAADWHALAGWAAQRAV